MKKLLILLMMLIGILSLVACGKETEDIISTVAEAPTSTPEPTPEPHVHTWIEADCQTPKSCSDCGETEGEPLSHDLTEATFENSSVCLICGEEVGEPREKVEIDLSDNEDLTDELLAELIENGDIPENVTHLTLSTAKLTDLSPLSTLTDISYLSFIGGKIIDISPLSALINLFELDLNFNPIDDLTALYDLPKLAQITLRDESIILTHPLSDTDNLALLTDWFTPINEARLAEEAAALAAAKPKTTTEQSKPTSTQPKAELTPAQRSYKEHFNDGREHLVIGEEYGSWIISSPDSENGIAYILQPPKTPSNNNGYWSCTVCGGEWSGCQERAAKDRLAVITDASLGLATPESVGHSSIADVIAEQQRLGAIAYGGWHEQVWIDN